jgi:hypothetical protein
MESLKDRKLTCSHTDTSLVLSSSCEVTKVKSIIISIWSVRKVYALVRPVRAVMILN